MSSTPDPKAGGGARRRRVWALAALAVALGVTAYLLTANPPAAPAPLDKLSIALPNVPHAGLLHIAAEQGYFAGEGLDASIAPVSHGKAALELLHQGKADLAAMADVVYLLAAMKGEPLGVAASVLRVARDNAVVARRDRSIAAPRDLAGKRIGVSFGTSGEYFLWAFLVRNKLALEAVTLVNLPPGRIAAALAEGSIDAAATWAPLWSEAQAALGDNALVFTESDVYTLNFLLAGHSGFLRAHPRTIEKLLWALLHAEEFQRAHPEAALNLVARRLKVGSETLRPTWNDFNFRVELKQSQLFTMEDQARWAMARGYAPSAELPNLLPRLYLDPLLALRPERVSVVR